MVKLAHNYEVDVRSVLLLAYVVFFFILYCTSFLVTSSIKRVNCLNFAIVAGIGAVLTIILATIFIYVSLTRLQLFGDLMIIIEILFVSLKKASKT